MTLAPGHFHAALVQKQALPGIHHRTHIYGPLDGDTLTHIHRIHSFNSRAKSPTTWDVDLRAGSDYLDRFAREQPGNTVVLSGRNRTKIDLMHLAVTNCLNVIADKPWIIEHEDFPKLIDLFHQAELRDTLLFDVLTERHEITNWLQREFTRDRELFGQWQAGNLERPALSLRSVHHLKKRVHGQSLTRPWWWFHTGISGEAMADVGTHLADLSLWLVTPEQEIDYKTDIQMLHADRSPLLVTQEQFAEVTGLPTYPNELHSQLAEGNLYYAGNNTASYTLCGVHVKLETAWEYESPQAGDIHESLARGTHSQIAIRQQPGGHPELFVTANNPNEHATILAALRDRCTALQRDFAGLHIEDLGDEARVVLPEAWRLGHEEHFAAVMDEYIRYFHTPRAVPQWEKHFALARYFITTKAVEIARAQRGHTPVGH